MEFTKENRLHKAKAVDIDMKGRLIVESEEGRLALNSGEISVVLVVEGGLGEDSAYLFSVQIYVVDPFYQRTFFGKLFYGQTYRASGADCDGYRIEAEKGKGYRLLDSGDLLSAERIRLYLPL